jgi:hypothetical protein
MAKCFAGSPLVIPVLILALISFSEAQQPKKAPRIGYQDTGSRSSAVVEAFQQGLRDLGYI